MDLDDVGRHLAAATRDEVPAWIERVVRSAVERSGAVVADDGWQALAEVAAHTGEVVADAMEHLAGTDVDAQTVTPLTVLRAAADVPTQLLADWGVDPVQREAWRVERFPDDVYDLAPAAFVDIGPRTHEAGIAWGAAKAIEHRRRHS